MRHAVDPDICDYAQAQLRRVNWDEKGLPQSATTTERDRKRQQTLQGSSQWTRALHKPLFETLEAAGVRKGRDGAKRFENIRGLRSLPTDGYDIRQHADQPGDQERHTDVSRETYDTYVAEHPDPHDAPLSLMLAVASGTRLRVCPYDRDGGYDRLDGADRVKPDDRVSVVVSLEPGAPPTNPCPAGRPSRPRQSTRLLHAPRAPAVVRFHPAWRCVATGDVLLFRGNLFHAGLGYAEHNDRVHAYVYPPSYRPHAAAIHDD